MRIGIPKEIKPHEYRVGLTPESVAELVHLGHSVLVEQNAGTGSGFLDQDFIRAGAMIVPTAAEAWAAELVVKVKEPQAREYTYLRPDLTLFTFLHLAADRPLTEALLKAKTTAIAYETVTGPTGGLPLLAPMSEVAGRMSIQAGSFYLQRAQGGSGVLLGGIPGVLPGKVTVIGGGVVGLNAARMAMGLGAEVVILDKSMIRLRELDQQFGPRLKTRMATMTALDQEVTSSDLVIGAVLVPGAAAPKLITRALLHQMRPGSVFVDVAIDQGGCAETSRATTHDEPTFVEEGVVHYCVTNIPGAVARTSTIGLNNVTMPYVQMLTNHGVMPALKGDVHLRAGLNCYDGRLTLEPLADQFDLPYEPLI